MSKIKVAVRTRPLSKKEVDANSKFITNIQGDIISVTNVKVDSHADFGDSRDRVKHFSYDYCYDSAVNPQSTAYASQELVFQDLGTEVLDAAFEGYNTCVLAYGQTSTGKTYTMMGNPDDPGLTPRICEGLFSHIDDVVGEKVRVDISYYEIYNERVRDLLRPSLRKGNDKYTLKVREHPKDGPYVQDLSSHCVRNNQEIQELLDRGQENRTTASTYMHDYSSRSHAIVTINYTQAQLEDDLPHEIVSKIHLVDLAGSERADPSWSNEYKGRLKEGSNINRSLVTLGNVIKSLAEKSLLSLSTDNLGSSQSFQSTSGNEGRSSPSTSPKRRVPYIPYRDSVLTWLLKDSLGGNSKTIMIATVTPASQYYNETVSTLRYAQRAKRIVNKPMINEDPNVALIRELRREIEKLRSLLASAAQSDMQVNDIMFVFPTLETHDKETEIQGSLVAVQDTGTFIAEKLRENEDMANKLTQTWKDKWQEAHDIIKDSDLSIRGLNKRASSMGVLIESQLPNLVGMDDDILSTGVMIYHLKEGKTLIGRDDADREQDIVINGPSVQKEHCFIKNYMGTVTLYVNRGAQVTINGIDCKGPTRLTQGDYILLGKTNMFRFNNPAEAAKLRERRESQEGILSCASSLNSLNTEENDNIFLRIPRPLSIPRGMNQQLERRFDSESERIEEARRELAALNQEQNQTEDQRNDSEERLWLSHERQRAEIEKQKIILAKLIEEVQIQKQKAEDEITFKRECLQKEKDAFQALLQEELDTIKQEEANQKLLRTTENDVLVIETPGGQTDKISQEEVSSAIQQRKLSLEGHIKALTQGELLKRLSYKQIEQDFIKHEEELEDELEQSQLKIESQVLKLKQLEDKYKSGDEEYYQAISEKSKQLDVIQQKKEQLELYIEEKQDLLSVTSANPRPLRMACSEEVLTDVQYLDAGFPLQTNSLKNLQRGSEGDLPAVSQRFSRASGLNITSSEYLHSSISDTMDVSEENSENLSVISDKESQKGTTKNSKISNAAKRVTDRLYTAPPPKFKREAKEKKPRSDKISKDVTGKKDDQKRNNEDERKKRAGTPRKSPMREDIGRVSKSPSTQRKAGDTNSKKVALGTQGKKKSDFPNRATSVTHQEKQKTPPLSSSRPSSSSSSSTLAKSRAPNKEHKMEKTPTSSYVERSATPPGLGHDHEVSDDNKSQQNIKITMSSPDLRLLSISPTPADRSGRIFVSRMPSTKLRHMASTPSLASVPEAVGEESDAMEMPTSPESATPQVVKRRNRRRIEGEKYKRHSAPVGEILANIFQNSGFSFTDNMDTDENLTLTSSAQPVEDLNYSSDIRSGENLTLTSSDVSDSDGGIQFTATPSGEKTDKQVLFTLDSKTNDGDADRIKCKSNSMDIMVNDSSEQLVSPEEECGTKVMDSIRMECDSELSVNENTNYSSSAVLNISKDQVNVNTNIDRCGVEIESEDSEMISAAVEGASECGDVQVSYISEHSVLLTNIPAEMQQVGKTCIENLKTSEALKTLPESSTSNVVFSGVRSEVDVDFICPNINDDIDEVDGDVCLEKQLKTGYKREILESDSTVIAAKCPKKDSYGENIETLTSQQSHSSLDMFDEESDSMLTVEQDSVSPQTHQHNIDYIETLEFGHSQGILHTVSSTDVTVCEDIQNVLSDENTHNLGHKDPDDRFSSDSLDSDSERQSKDDKNKADLSSDSLDVSGNSDIMDSLSPHLSNDGDFDIPPTDRPSYNVLQGEATLPTREVIPPDSLSLPSQVGRKSTDSVRGDIDKTATKDSLIVSEQFDTAGVMLSPIMEESKTENTDNSQTRVEESDIASINIAVIISDIASEIHEDNRRTLGTCTSPDFTFPEEVNQPRQSEPESDDSLQEVQEQLQVLQEALDQKSPRNSNGNNTQLSSARKAVRQRAVIRQKQRGCNEESDDIDHFSDDSISSESQPKSSSRSELTSRRRRRINNKSNRKAKRWKGLSSEEYISSDSDGIYSDNSVTGHVEFSSGDNTNDDYITGENRPSDVHCRNYTTTCVSDLSDSDTKITVELTGCFLSSQKMNKSKLNGFGGLSDVTEGRQEKVNENIDMDDSESHSRSSSETRSVQTDISLIGNGNLEAQNSDGYYSDLAVSPLCIWSSGDKKTQYHQPHSKRTPKTKVEYNVRKNKYPKQENLAISVTDQWSAETSTSRKKSASSVSSDSSYVMEMETLSPQLPSPSDRFIQEGQCSPPQDMSCLGVTFPVVYEVTVKEDLTNVFYNVDRTEIKTYGLRSQINSDGAQIIPDSININLHETTTNSREKRSETVYREEVTFRNSDHQDSPVDSVISETNYCSISDISVENPGTNQEVCREQQVIAEKTDSYINQQCESKIENAPDLETVISPRESDTTSDYGTLVESKLGNSSCLSGSQSTIPGDLEYSPVDDSVFHKSNEESNKNEFSFDAEITPDTVTDLQVGVNNIQQSVGESINYITVQGHQLCQSEDTNSNKLRPGVSHISRPPELISNVIQQNQDNSVSDNLNNNDKICNDSNKTLARTSSSDSDYNVEYSEEVVTLTVENLPSDDKYIGTDSESTETINNITPTQSKDNVQIEPDTQTLKQVNEQTITELSAPKPTFSLLSPQRSLKTVSVNTDSEEQPDTIQSNTTECSFREDLKRELQQKLARLQRHVRSLSDSAISSDFTDGDSTSASPRGSRLCESDKVLRSSGGFGVSPTFKIPPVTNIEVMTTQSDSRYEQSRTSPFTNSATASLDIDKKLVRKSPFKDSGNVFDEDNIDTEEPRDTTEINTEQEFVNNLTKNSDNSESAPSDDKYCLKQESGEISLSGSEEIEYEEERSLSPGEIVLKPGIITSSELYHTFASGLMSMDETGAMENQDGARQLSFQHKGYKEKSPSLSALNEHKETEDYRRSMSENCIDQYEERTHSSNESIVFVFMGQSHTNESMEELKSFTSSHKEYKVHEDDERNNNTHDDSNITNEENEENVSDTAEDDQNKRNMSRSVSESENSVDTSPLRHRYGIDSNVLPIPERSISSDNLPKETSDQPGIHRSRSADMLAVGVIEDPSGNEGVFPPCFNGDTSGSNEENMSDTSVNSKSSADETDKQTEDEKVNSTQEILYAEIETSQMEQAKPQEVSYEGHISDDEIVTLTRNTHKPESAERGVTTGMEETSPVVSVGVQVSLSDSSTQTDSSYNSIAGEFLPSNVLPALESDYRAQSMVNIGETPGPTQLNLSEGTEEWYNLSNIVLENRTILKNIKQNITGVSVNTAMDVKEMVDSSVCSNSNKDDSTQTGGSLTNLQSSGIQTDELFDFEDHKNNSCVSTTQTGSGVVSLLEIAEVESTDYRPSPPPKPCRDMSIQTMDFTTERAKTREISIQTIQTGPSETYIESDYSKNVSSESKADYTNSRNVRQGYQPVLKSMSEIKEQHDWHHYEIEQQEPQEETITETIVYNISQTPEITEEKIIESKKKHESKKSDDQVVVTEREFRLSTEVELPDLETSNAQMEALKEEHSKMMASFKKAADDRKERVQASKYNKRLSASMTRAELETIRKEMETVTTESNKSDVHSSSEDLKSENVESYSRALTQEELEILMKSMARKASTDVTNIDKTSNDYRVKDSWENREKSSTSSVIYDKSRDNEKKNENLSTTTTMKYAIKQMPTSSVEEVKYPESNSKDKKILEKKENFSTTSTVIYDKPEYDGKKNQNLSSTSSERYKSENDKERPTSPEDEVEYSESTFYIYNIQSEDKNDEEDENTNQEEKSLYHEVKQQVEFIENDMNKPNVQQEKQPTEKTTHYTYQEINTTNVPTRQETLPNRDVSDEDRYSSVNKSDLQSREISQHVEEETLCSPFTQSTPWEKQRTEKEMKNLDVKENKKDENNQTNSKMSDGAILNQKIMSAFAEQDHPRKQQTNYYQIKRSNIDTCDMSGYREEKEDVLSDTIGSPTCGTPPNSPLTQGDEMINRFTIYNDSQINMKNSDNLDSSDVVDSCGDKSKYETMYSESITPKSILQDTIKQQENDSYNSIKLYTPKKKTTYDKSVTMTTEFTPLENKTSQYSRTLNTNNTSSNQPSYSDIEHAIYPDITMNVSGLQNASTALPSTYVRKTGSTVIENPTSDHIKYKQQSPSTRKGSSQETETEKNDATKLTLSSITRGITPTTMQSVYTQEVSTLPSQELIMPSKFTRSYVSRDYVRDNKVSTGVEVCVDSSDDFTQTDLRLDLTSLTGDRGARDSKTNDKIKEDLERLQKERVEIIELLSLNYLPASLTIELLERKLNYCIGQTDLLLESLGENLDFEIHELNITTSHDTREYLSKYKESLRQSKRDIEICKERMDRRQGTGRGRTIGRNRDLFRLRRNAEIEVFKAERSIEQLKHRQEKTVNPWKNISASIHDRFDRSVRDASPSSTSSTPRTMTPKQHRDHLIELRRQLVKATKDEDFRQRTFRSSSPRLTKTERDRYFGSSYRYKDRTRDRSLPLSTYYEAPIDHKTDVSYGISSYVMPPSYTESLQAPRSYSYDVSLSSSDTQGYDRSSSPYYSNYDHVDSRRYHSVDSSRTYSSPIYDDIPFSKNTNQQNDSANSSFGESTYRYHSVDMANRSDRSRLSSPVIDTRHHSLETNYQVSVNNFTQGARSQSVDSRQDRTSYLYSPPLSREQSPHSITSFGAKYPSTRFESPTQQLINRSRSKVESRVYSPMQGLVDVQTKSSKTEQWYDTETKALLKEISEMKQHNQQEISRARDNLVTYRRDSGSTQGDKPIDTSGGSDSPNYTGERRRRSYSSYKDYATDILQSSRQSLGSVSGTYELYDTSPNIYGTQSQNSSFMSEDLESLADSVHSENIHTFSQGYENKFKTTRPVRSSDLKSKVFLRKKLHL